MRTVARGIAIALAVALAACGGASSTGTTTSNSYQGKTIQLGAILSLTGAGGVYGPSSQKGMDLAVEKINNSGGVNGATIALDTKDDASDRPQSAQGAQTLIQLRATGRFRKTAADLAPPVTRAVQNNPGVIFIPSLGGTPAKIMIEARKQGFTGQFLGGNGFNTAVVSKQAGDAGKGAESGSAREINNTFPPNARLVQAHPAKYSADPDQFAAPGYAAILGP